MFNLSACFNGCCAMRSFKCMTLMQSVGMNIPRYLGVFISSSLRNHGFYAETNNSTVTPFFLFCYNTNWPIECANLAIRCGVHTLLCCLQFDQWFSLKAPT